MSDKENMREFMLRAGLELKLKGCSVILDEDVVVKCGYDLIYTTYGMSSASHDGAFDKIEEITCPYNYEDGNDTDSSSVS